MIKGLLSTDKSRSTILIRIMVGSVFLSEGIQKFLFPDKVGAGRFAKIGFPDSEFYAELVGSFEIVCGILLLIGLLTRFASIPLLTIILAAIIHTKLKLIAEQGIWHMMHESRTDFAMLMGLIFLIIKGAGEYSSDSMLFRRVRS